MSLMKRRHFLQFAGSTLAAMGMSQTHFLRQANHYGNALAQSTPRKLALLIGINQYQNPSISNLSGCLNDVEMQYNLLVYRFGFNPANILTLTDNETDPSRQPSRANILRAFEEHLIQQAAPGDVVVVHYSGHGSRVKDPNPVLIEACRENSQGFSNLEGLNGTLVPNDLTSAGQNPGEIVVPDIMGRSLFLLMERIQTEQLTVVLDSCFSGGGTRGNARVRSVNSRLGRDQETFVASPEEFENQERWRKELSITADEFQSRRARGIAKGTTLGSASCDQVAFELPFGPGHVSGTFTYLLTSYLWQSSAAEAAATVQANLVRSTRTTVKYGTQVPIFEYKPGSQHAQQPLYFAEMTAPFATGVVTNVTADGLQLWLGGVSHQNLNTASPGTVYALLNKDGQEVGQVVLEQLTRGLLGFGRLAEGSSVAVQAGMLLREKILAIPNPTLRIGIDPSLGNDTAQAQTTLQSALTTTLPSGQIINRLTLVPVDQQSEIEYLFARTTPDIQALLRQAGETTPPPIGTLALFAADFSSVVPQTFDVIDETPIAAVNRLRPRLKSLLVARVLKELATVTTSDFKIEGSVIAANGRGVAVPIVPSQGSLGRSGSNGVTARVPFYTDEEIKIQVKNQQNHDVFLSVLGIGSSGQIVVLQPANWDAPVEASRVAENEEILVPSAADGVKFSLSGTGYVELITLVSKTPLRSLLQSLQTISRGAGRTRGFVGLEEGDPLNLITDLLGDLDAVSRSANTADFIQATTDTSTVDSQSVAVFSTVIEVVENPRENA